ncbi:MAG TPA: N-succinylarginine dihydrolase [Usitatibacteraceae bacterium]|nr:N-succinylarginine dihydrolase [Usitatibacteraceae bacterium]
MTAHEYNFDGLVGPTHNYSGLSYGNIASTRNQGAIANPREAALQGLAKMKALMDRGFKQGVFAPQQRPDIATLRQLGFSGSDTEVLQSAAGHSRAIFNSALSASSMWTANAATVSPSANTADGRVHFSVANLAQNFHRAIEHPTTGRILRAMFPAGRHFVHHDALPATPSFGDEGAANHTRFCPAIGAPGVELFVYGCVGFDSRAPRPQKYPARQSLEASQAIARRHGLSDARAVFAQQNPDAIDQGVFHNDVIAVGHRNVLFCHEQAFLDREGTCRQLREKFGEGLVILEVPADAVSVADAVGSYLFNSQLLSKPDGKIAIVVPQECRNNARVSACLDELIASGGPIDEALVFDLRQSMMNGGGPACLRLRVELNEAEAAAANPGVILTSTLHGELVDWVRRHYRDRMADADLLDPQLPQAVCTALDELTRILKLGSVYPFQLG